MGQTEEYYQALRYRGIPTAMIRFRDEWHGTSSRPSNFMRTQLYLRGWFERMGERSATFRVQAHDAHEVVCEATVTLVAAQRDQMESRIAAEASAAERER